jgi:hypothetical protein
VYAGTDPLTRRAIRLKSTVKTEQQAQIKLGELLKDASEGRTPESGATVAKLMDEYAAVAEWDVSTRQTNEGFIRRTIKPALGPMKVRKVRGPILDKLCAELKRCGYLSCTGKPFIEHRNVPVLVVNPRDRRPPWQQVAATLAEVMRSGILVPGDELPSITEARARNAALGLYLWLVVVTGVRHGELCGLQIRDIDLDRGLVHVAFNYVVRGGQRVRKDTKTHQDRWLAIGGKTLSRRLACRDRLPCGSVVTGEFRPGPAD